MYFFVDDDFYSDTDSLADDIAIQYDSDDEKVPLDIEVECYEADLEPVFQLDAGKLFDWLYDRYDYRIPEDDRVLEEIDKALSSIDYAEVNRLLPSVFYPSKRKFILTYDDLYD